MNLFHKILVPSVLLLFVISNTSAAQKSNNELKQLRLAPGHIRVMILDDPAHKMVVGWNNYLGFDEETRFYYDTIDHGLNISDYKYSQKADVGWIFRAMNNQFVVLKNLQADTKYYFVIKNGEGLSKRYYFQTLPDNSDARISVIAGGDSRNNRVTRRRANSLVRKLRPHFVMFGGDMTSIGLSHQWINWFDDWQETIGEDGRVTPVAVTRGNHEIHNTIIEHLFYTKKGVYYSFGVAGDLLRVYTLNSEITTGGSQAAWLENDLRANQDAIWKFAQYHRPMRPHVGGKKDQAGSYKNWAPLFYQYGVNLVIESDAHTGKITWPIRPEADGDHGFVIDELMGTVYAGEGCWGAPLRAPNDKKSWTRDAEMFNHFNWIWISRDEVEMRTVRVDNADEVSSLTENKRFSLPENIHLWNPKNGSVVKLVPRNILAQKMKKDNKKMAESK